MKVTIILCLALVIPLIATADEVEISMGSGGSLLIHADGSIGECNGTPEICEQMIKNHYKDLEDSKNTYQLIAKRKYIDTVRGACHLITQYGKRWGLNDAYIEDCRVAYNETFNYKKVE